jgi:hypothetical protein
MNRYPLLLTISFISSFAGNSLIAQSPSAVRRSVQAVRIEGEIALTGKLNDPKWLLANAIDCPFEVDPGENIPAAQRTVARILYSNEYLYVGFDCNDSVPSSIRANISDRDKIFHDDFVVLFLDTYGDSQRSYEFFVNPFGIQADIFRNGNNEDDSFDAVWESKANINDHGWTAELAIPYKSIRFPATEEQRWNILVGRQYPRANRAIFSWTSFDRNNPCLACQGGPLEGVRGIQATNSAEILPYVLGSQHSALRDDSDPVSPFDQNPLKGRMGGSVKFSPSPAITFEGVVSPDFSQVESDADQISVNTTFALSYPEKRPFFIEGSDLFKNRLQTYYSRSINNPRGAVKLTGRRGAVSYGLIAAEDQNASLIVPGEESSSDPIETRMNSVVSVGRARYEFAEQSFVGAMFSTRNTGDANNYSSGVDLNYAFGGNNYLRGELFVSSTKELNDTNLFLDTRTFGSTGYEASLNGESYTGTAMRFGLSHEGREYNASLSYQDLSPLFQAQNGFVTQNNFRLANIEQGYTFYFTESFVNRIFLNNFMGMRLNYDNVLKERFAGLGVGANMQGQTFANIFFLVLNQERFKGVWFENVPRLFFNFNSTPVNGLSVETHFAFGNFIYRDTPELGYGHEFSAGISVRPTSQLRIDLSYNRARLSSSATDNLFYDGNIYRANGTYQFTAQTFLRFILQYNSFDEPTLNIYPLFSYKLNPFTIFYAGFTDNRQEFGGANGFLTTQRQFFVKFQYLLRS